MYGDDFVLMIKLSISIQMNASFLIYMIAHAVLPMSAG